MLWSLSKPNFFLEVLNMRFHLVAAIALMFAATVQAQVTTTTKGPLGRTTVTTQSPVANAPVVNAPVAVPIAPAAPAVGVAPAPEVPAQAGATVSATPYATGTAAVYTPPADYRMQYHSGNWWYYNPNNTWSYYSNNAWTNYVTPQSGAITQGQERRLERRAARNSP
jgi:hypothetical protein